MGGDGAGLVQGNGLDREEWKETLPRSEIGRRVPRRCVEHVVKCSKQPPAPVHLHNGPVELCRGRLHLGTTPRSGGGSVPGHRRSVHSQLGSG